MANRLPLDELSLVLARIKGMLLTEEKVDRAVQLLAEAIRDAIPGTTGAGVSLLDDRGRRMSHGATDAVVEQADATQYDLGQGPCLTAWAARTTVLIDDVAKDKHWLRWSTAVASLPVRSVVSTPLIAGTDCIGALKIYAAVPSAYDAAVARLLEKFTGPAATLLANIQGNETPHRISETLESALGSRDTINRAYGLLMERHGFGPEQSMQDLLRIALTQKIPLLQASAALLDSASSDAASGKE
ncbi:GAF and ANTAR domain-containing protein [Arthrobacter sp. D1-17]